MLIKPKSWESHWLNSWIEAARKRFHHNVLAIALANKLARIAWSVLARGRGFEATFAGSAGAGLRCHGIIAPCVIDGPMNGEAFLAYVEQILAPTLEPDQFVIMDKLSSHKGLRRRTSHHRLQGNAALPAAIQPGPQSDREPLRQAKALLRAAAERTIDSLWDRIGSPLHLFIPHECRNYFRHAGYA